ncbi:uncharacterized protein LOC113229702 [Hyposmocoma kahamanoa]|uniref:uncharacterized protein LOC113229702 n=1 Tax=Hyposmocoma kahamanoa TaxID=1477025 RepID=UPI000E6D6928|nr:uncharacterized protein LOC113229702 [Hyposmocoma kahamanoa]
MATVVITFFLARFYVSKMDADFEQKRRARISARRETRWSMNSQRLEEIVAELMRPISDVRHSFDTDLSALLEEYLTEAGLHALDAEENEHGADAAPVNFAELALLLQQSANIYGRKVNFLYQNVLFVRDSLYNSTIEISNTHREEEAAPARVAAAAEAPSPATAAARRRGNASAGAGDFALIQLEPAAAARREAEAPRPPPTLPRMYIELEPRQLADADVPLTDYADEPVGLLSDFHVAWRLRDGLLVDELEGCAATSGSSLRPIPLLELQAAIEANAPPSPPPLSHDESPPREAPVASSTPLPVAEMPPPPPKRERKRKAAAGAEPAAGGKFQLVAIEALRRPRPRREFGVEAAWLRRVLAGRARRLLQLRRRLRAHERLARFRGFEFSCLDASEASRKSSSGEVPPSGNERTTGPASAGFAGWSDAEAARALEEARAAARLSSRLDDSDDDDGFFEQSEHSSLGDADAPLPRSPGAWKICGECSNLLEFSGYRKLDKRKKCLSVFLDLKRAFDTVSLSILIKNANIFSYADDTAIVFTDNSWDTLKSSAERGLERVTPVSAHALLSLKLHNQNIWVFLWTSDSRGIHTSNMSLKE